MNPLRAFVLVSLAVALAGCMNIHDPKKLKETPTDDLCEMYYFAGQSSITHDTGWPTKKADIKKEIDSRQAVSPDEWNLIDMGKLQVGMSECGLKAAWGYPQRVTHAVTAAGASTHYIYTLTRTADVANGRVTGFQF